MFFLSPASDTWPGRPPPISHVKIAFCSYWTLNALPWHTCLELL